MKVTDGRISAAEWVPSPNFGPRPTGVDISLLVIHNISLPPGEYGGGYIQQFFRNKLNKDQHPYFAEIAELRVSSHLLIERTGKLIQFVSLYDRAWHAGVSCFAGQENCNDYSIGIELEGCDEEPYSNEQYQRLAEVTSCLLEHFPHMTQERITGHEDIAPGRKTDPGPAFDWPEYRRLLASC